MNIKLNRLSKYILAFSIAVALVGCFKILNVVQPSSATVGDQITSTVTVSVEGQSDANPHYGIVGLLVPNDWTIDNVVFSGAYQDTCLFLPADSSDSEPGGLVDYWTDSLEARYPSGTDMKWIVYQSKTSHVTINDTVSVDVSVKMTVGQAQGNYNLGYFVSDAALDFTDASYYAVSLNHAINVTGVVPVELTSFMAQASSNGVELSWSTATETNNKGFVVERSSNKVDFSQIGFVNGVGTSTQMHRYSFIDSKTSGEKYYYRLNQIDLNGTFKYSKIIEVTNLVPSEFNLSQNYPNPFNPSTSINFALPTESFVVVKLYDSRGREISTLTNGNYAPGQHSINFDASKLASGTYIYSITATGKDGQQFTSSKKMMLLK